MHYCICCIWLIDSYPEAAGNHAWKGIEESKLNRTIDQVKIQSVQINIWLLVKRKTARIKLFNAIALCKKTCISNNFEMKLRAGMSPYLFKWYKQPKSSHKVCPATLQKYYIMLYGDSTGSNARWQFTVPWNIINKLSKWIHPIQVIET